MKKMYFIILFFSIFHLSGIAQDSYLETPGNFTAEDILPDKTMFSTYDIHGDVLYGNMGDTIWALNMQTGDTLNSYAKPADYASYPGFVYVTNDGSTIWAGFTVSDNTDDRIYKIDPATGEWELAANLTGNFDMAMVAGKHLVSAATYGSPNKIYVLDTSATNDHRALIETGGNSAGLGTDLNENLYYATSQTESNKVVKFNAADIYNALDTENDTLKIENAEVLTQIPAGAYDCEADEAGNIIFNINDYAGEKVLAMWNGTAGSEYNYDTLATASGDSDWFTMIKTKGNVLNPGADNGAYVHSYTRPIAKVQGNNYPPVVAEPFDIIQSYESGNEINLDLASYFTDSDDEDNFTFEIISNAHSEVATANIEAGTLTITPLAEGQTHITIEATNAGRSVTAQQIVGVYPEINGDYHVANFENFELANGSYWNGEDGSGSFTSGKILYPNTYNETYGYWGGWAYSNMADDTTAGYANQYSAITAAGFEPESSEGSTYGISYATAFDAPVLKFTDSVARAVEGFYVTNNTYTALSMKYGDAYAKKFGGPTGNDPDWLKLAVWGFAGADVTDTVNFYLADYRFDDNTKDYIIQTWQWVDLTELGEIDSLQMALSSSDMGEYGMNTPAYYCADNFYIAPAVGIENNSTQQPQITTYPNPTNGKVVIKSQSQNINAVQVYDQTGRIVKQIENSSKLQHINLSRQPAGIYLIKFAAGDKVMTEKIIKH